MSDLISSNRRVVWSWCHRFALDCAPLRCALPGGRFGLAGAAMVGRLAGMSMDSELQKHYALLLGIGSPWEVKDVALKLAEKKWRSSWAGNGELTLSVRSAGGPVRSMTARQSGRGGTWTRCNSSR